MLPQHKTWSVFVLSSVVQGYKPGQDEVQLTNMDIALLIRNHFLSLYTLKIKY
jgi:hypothetical protein